MTVVGYWVYVLSKKRSPQHLAFKGTENGCVPSEPSKKPAAWPSHLQRANAAWLSQIILRRTTPTVPVLGGHRCSFPCHLYGINDITNAVKDNCLEKHHRIHPVGWGMSTYNNSSNNKYAMYIVKHTQKTLNTSFGARFSVTCLRKYFRSWRVNVRPIASKNTSLLDVHQSMALTHQATRFNAMRTFWLNTVVGPLSTFRTTPLTIAWLRFFRSCDRIACNLLAQ